MVGLTAFVCLLGFTMSASDNVLPSVSSSAVRTTESFDEGWLFARYGLQPDGSRKPEPGAPAWEFALTASSEETSRGNMAFCAMDGNPKTRWCAADASTGQWLMVDLGKPHQIGKYEIEWESEGEYAATVVGSLDGNTWNPLPCAARIVRVAVDRTPSGSWASIRELRLIDSKGALLANKQKPRGQAPSDPTFDDSKWRKLDLPHDWGIEGPFRIELDGDTGKLPWKGIGWYRKSFVVPASDKRKRVFIDFDGAMANSEVYLNGKKVGGWPYGYSSFRLELTPFLFLGKANLLAVRLNTEKWGSRWYPGAGIYRHVRLVKTSPVHVAHWGTYVTTPNVTENEAEVKVEITVENQAAKETKAELKVQIVEIDKKGLAGKSVAKAAVKPFVIKKGNSACQTIKLNVSKPKLWDLHAPNRYAVQTTVLVGGEPIDAYDSIFGIRTIEFTARDGFKLNGKRVPINGTCNHHDLGALGAAMNGRALERQLEILKSMGCNALRTSHNPPAPELLELADRMGFLVWDEAFDCWAHGKKADDYGAIFDEWHVKDLEALVKRDRNHPSVIIWSIGNEVWEQEDVALTKHLADTMRSFDPTRPISNGYNNPEGGRESGAALALGVMGINYYFRNQDKWDADPRYKNMPTMGSETASCISTRGEYYFDGNKNWQVSSYDLDQPGWGHIPDDQFRFMSRWPHLLGEFVWTGFDYLGEPTPYNSDHTNLLNFRNDPSKKAELEKELEKLRLTTPLSRSSYFGIVDLAGFPKDRYYSYQSLWRPDTPVAHLFPHWNWPERIGQKVPVHLYTSGESAELFVNGKSQGLKTKKPGQDFRLVWPDVIYEPGEIMAVCYKDGKVWASDTVSTTSKSYEVKLFADRTKVANDGKDLVFVTAKVVDAYGRTVPRANNLIRFSVEGPGDVIATDNGDPTTFRSFQSKDREAFNGLALAIVKATKGKSGQIVIKASSNGLKTNSIEIKTVKPDSNATNQVKSSN